MPPGETEKHSDAAGVRGVATLAGDPRPDDRRETENFARRALLGLPPYVFCVAAVLAVACVAPFDANLLNWVRSTLDPQSRLQGFVIGMEVLGSWRAGAVINFMMLLHPRRWWLLAGYAVPVVVCSIATHVLKFLIGRARPYVEDAGPWALRPFSNPMEKYDSFPSGHAFYAFVLVGLLATYFPAYRWLFVMIGFLVALARVAAAAHWPSDTAAGAALGCLLVYACVRTGGRMWYER